MDRRTVVSLPFLRWAACTIDTNGGLLSRSFATPYLVRSVPYLVRSVPSPRFRLAEFSSQKQPFHPRGGPFGARNRPAEHHFRFLSLLVM